MALPEYRNLTQDELDLADHYAETGNFSGLRRMRELSGSRESDGRALVNRDTQMVDAGMMPTRSNNIFFND